MTASKITAKRSVGIALTGIWVLAGMIGCGAGVNDDLAATLTPYPVRSPVAAVATPTGDDGDSGSFVDAGERALAAGDAIGAERAFDRALARDADHPAALIGRAKARLARRDLPGAIADVDVLSRATIDDESALVARGELLVRFGRYQDAEKDFAAAITSDSGLATAFVGRATAFVLGAAGEHGRYEAALADFRRALAIDPTSTAALLGPALVLIDRAEFGGDPADWEVAERELTVAASSVDVVVPAWAVLAARIRGARGDIDGAMSAIDEALGVATDEPDVGRLRAVEAELLVERSDWDRAVTAAERGIAADPLAWDARYALVSALLGAHRGEEALAAADEVLNLRPGDGRGQYLLGLTLEVLGDANGAKAALDAAAAVLPASPVFQARIATALDRVEAGGDATFDSTSTPMARLRPLDGETPAARVVR